MQHNVFVCKHIFTIVVSFFIILMSTTSNAALLGRDLDGDSATYEAVYDDVLDISWLTNANLAASENFGIGGIASDGQLNWYTANNWIAAMNASDGGKGYFGFDDWRLPSQTTANSSIYSELGYLFYEYLGGTAGSSALSDPNNYLSLFSNYQDFLLYWTGTPSSSTDAWAFSTFDGGQATLEKFKVFFSYAWAVRSGDVLKNGGVVIPIPAAFWLFGTAIIGLIGFSRRN